jgi:tRNA(Met) C34 N-acetyltransferase TmcA
MEAFGLQPVLIKKGSVIILNLMKLCQWRTLMTLKNKLTRETLEITYPEFRKRFAKEIHDAFESYRKTQLNKYSYNFKDDNSMEFNFYFELHWNFNHFGNSNWYIERM